MALISCPDCHSQVSDLAPACPKCGRPVLLKKGLSSRETPQIVNTQPKKGRAMKRALMIEAGIVVLLTIAPAVVRHWRAAPAGTPEHSLQQLAMAARLGLWGVADEYVDRGALRREMMRTSYELMAAEHPCPKCPGGTLLEPFEDWQRHSTDQMSKPIENLIAVVCEFGEAKPATVVRSADDRWAEVTYPPQHGYVYRVKMERVNSQRWRLVGLPSAKENIGPGFRRARLASDGQPVNTLPYTLARRLQVFCS